MQVQFIYMPESAFHMLFILNGCSEIIALSLNFRINKPLGLCWMDVYLKYQP